MSNLAFLQLETEQYLESEKNFLICLRHFKKQLDRLGQAAVFGILGTLYFKWEKFENAIDNYNTAFKVYQELNQIEEQITCLKGIGNCLIKLNQFERASEIFLECSSICSDNNDIYNLLDCLGNLIFIYEKEQKWDVVFELYRKSLHAFKELKDIKGIIVSYYNLGTLRKRSNKYDEALRYFKKGTNLSIESNFSELIIKGLTYIGETFFYQGNMNSAKNQYIKALSLAEKMNNKNTILQIKIILNSFGLNEEEINHELKVYQKQKKSI
ncbi:MAG: tetratricopeptide repeat protein [Candidatus Hodarchaeota archaeon]